jgi:hypothetical protein
MTTDTLIEALISSGYASRPHGKTITRPAFNGDGFVTISGDSTLSQIYVSVAHNRGGTLARWVDLSADAIESFIARAERIIMEWDSMTITFAGVNA